MKIHLKYDKVNVQNAQFNVLVISIGACGVVNLKNFAAKLVNPEDQLAAPNCTRMCHNESQFSQISTAAMADHISERERGRRDGKCPFQTEFLDPPLLHLTQFYVKNSPRNRGMGSTFDIMKSRGARC